MGEGLIVRRGGGMGLTLPMELVDKTSTMLNTATNTAVASIAVPESGTYLCVAFGANSTNTFFNNSHGASGGVIVIRNGEIVQKDLRYFTFAAGIYDAQGGEAEIVDGTLTVSVTVPPFWSATTYKGLGLMLYRLDGAATSGAPEEITFTVAGTQYTDSEGMTWAEFVASDYNTKDEYGNSMFNIYSGNVYYIAWYNDEGNYEDTGSPFYSWILEPEEGIYQTADMSILPGAVYHTDD